MPVAAIPETHLHQHTPDLYFVCFIMNVTFNLNRTISLSVFKMYVFEHADDFLITRAFSSTLAWAMACVKKLEMGARFAASHCIVALRCTILNSCNAVGELLPRLHRLACVPICYWAADAIIPKMQWRWITDGWSSQAGKMHWCERMSVNFYFSTLRICVLCIHSLKWRFNEWESSRRHTYVLFMYRVMKWMMQRDDIQNASEWCTS